MVFTSRAPVSSDAGAYEFISSRKVLQFMLELVVGIIGIVVTVISITVTIINTVQTANSNREHKKNDRTYHS